MPRVDHGPPTTPDHDAPSWALVAGAAMLLLALALTVMGPRSFRPVTTRSVGTVVTVPASAGRQSGN